MKKHDWWSNLEMCECLCVYRENCEELYLSLWNDHWILLSRVEVYKGMIPDWMVGLILDPLTLDLNIWKLSVLSVVMFIVAPTLKDSDDPNLYLFMIVLKKINSCPLLSKTMEFFSDSSIIL